MGAMQEPCEDRGSNGRDVSISQGMPCTASSPQKLEGFSFRAVKGKACLLDFGISGLQNSGRVTFCCFKPPHCGNLLWPP